jgi:hypothetical protein
MRDIGEDLIDISRSLAKMWVSVYRVLSKSLAALET